MNLDVHRALGNPGEPVPFTLAVQLADFEFDGDRYAPDGELTVMGTVTALKERIAMSGHVRGRLIGHCARCLDDVACDIEGELDEVFDPDPPVDEPDWFSYRAATLDLTDAVTTAVIQALPPRLLCREDCAGLCPACGARQGTCDCPPQERVLSRFSALQDVQIETETRE